MMYWSVRSFGLTAFKIVEKLVVNYFGLWKSPRRRAPSRFSTPSLQLNKRRTCQVFLLPLRDVLSRQRLRQLIPDFVSLDSGCARCFPDAVQRESVHR